MSKKKHLWDDLSRRRALRHWGFYLLALLAWVPVVLLLAYLGMIVCRSIIWYDSNPIYWFLQWVRDYIVLICMVVVLMGWVAISYFFLTRPIQQLQAMLDAARRLAQPTQEPIVLPTGMQEVEVQLNLIREEALRTQQAAREAEQRKNDLVVYLAHDLKTPLTSVIGYLTLLRDEPQLSPELRARYTGVALDKAERLEELVNEFFDITRFNLTHLELEKRPVDLSRMLQQMASEFAPILSQHRLTCALDLPAQLEYLCDPDKLARVFDNLLRNACYYALPDTVVQISGQESEDEVLLTFTNQGRTIPQEKLDRIFEQFFRLDSARSSGTGGAGLGLAIAKEIVELHGGTISAKSDEGEIVFTIRLPSAPQENRKNSDSIS